MQVVELENNQIPQIVLLALPLPERGSVLAFVHRQILVLLKFSLIMSVRNLLILIVASIAQKRVSMIISLQARTLLLCASMERVTPSQALIGLLLTILIPRMEIPY